MFISERLAKQLKIKTTPTNISVFGINNSCSQLQEKCQISIKSVINKYQSNLNCIVVPNISGNIPTQKIVIDNWHIPANIKLANPQFNISTPVDLLIGADVFWNILLKERISLGTNKPLLINSVFGYLVSGSLNIPTQKQTSCNVAINIDLQKFWALEEINDETHHLSKDEVASKSTLKKQNRAINQENL